MMGAHGFFGYSREEQEAGLDAVQDAWDREQKAALQSRDTNPKTQEDAQGGEK